MIDGTGKNIKVPGYEGELAGKTGTAQKFVDGTYSHTQFVSSFIGFMPAEDPAFVALVMVDDPKTKKYYGAEVSAPVFADMATQVAQIMNLTPTQPIPAPPALSSNVNTSSTP
jgi:cell division protein FtsI (penicillin-binding protein 3)/stage V sporulation protein D (sporulation-specific penicillin-binding protein)